MTDPTAVTQFAYGAIAMLVVVLAVFCTAEAVARWRRRDDEEWWP